MPKHLMSYWKPQTAKREREKKGDSPVVHSASNQCGRVASGDTVWIVTQDDGQLYLLARIIVETRMSHQEAISYLNDGEIWLAAYHVFGNKSNAATMRHMSLSGINRQIRFTGKNDRLLVADDGTTSAQQLQTMRQLTASTAGLLTQLWNESGDQSKQTGSDEPR